MITVLRALGNPSLGDIYQPAKDQFDGSGSYGNGGGMRIAPLGLFCYGMPFSDLEVCTFLYGFCPNSLRCIGLA